MNNQNNQQDEQSATVPEIDPRFAAAHYGNDLKPVEDIKSRLRIKTPNAWELMSVASEAADYITTLESEAEQLRMSVHNARIEVAELESQLETERMRLAACGVAALSNTAGTVDQRIPRDNPYWSASYNDVCSAVDREMDLREKLIARNEQIAAQAGQEDILAKVWIHCFPDGDYDIHDSASFPDRAPRDATRYPDKEVPCPGCVGAVIIKRDWLDASPPAPANSLAIVQAALEAAAHACESLQIPISINTWIGTKKEVSAATANGLAEAIRAINPQSIIDGMSK